MSNIQVVRNTTHDAHRSLATKYHSALYHNLFLSGMVGTASWVPEHVDQDRYNNRGVKVRKKQSLDDNYPADKFSTYTYNEQLLRTEKMLPCPVLLAEARDNLNSLGTAGSSTWSVKLLKT